MQLVISGTGSQVSDFISTSKELGTGPTRPSDSVPCRHFYSEAGALNQVRFLRNLGIVIFYGQ